MIVQNLKNIRVKTADLDIANLSSQEMPDERWAVIYASSKPVRDAVARGFLRAVKSPEKPQIIKSPVKVETKSDKRSFRTSTQFQHKD